MVLPDPCIRRVLLPSAIRIPISRVRWATACASTPYTPMEDSPRPTITEGQLASVRLAAQAEHRIGIVLDAIKVLRPTALALCRSRRRSGLR